MCSTAHINYMAGEQGTPESLRHLGDIVHINFCGVDFFYMHVHVAVKLVERTCYVLWIITDQ